MDTKNAQKFVKALRNNLKHSQAEFADYLNKSTYIEGSNYNQSSICKMETKYAKIPSDILLHCLSETLEINSNIEYPIDELMKTLNKLDPITHYETLKNMHILAKNCTT